MDFNAKTIIIFTFQLYPPELCLGSLRFPGITVDLNVGERWGFIDENEQLLSTA